MPLLLLLLVAPKIITATSTTILETTVITFYNAITFTTVAAQALITVKTTDTLTAADF